MAVAADFMNLIVRLLCILAGALALSFLVAVSLLIPLGQWYEMSWARCFDDVSDAYVLSLAIQALCAIAGGWLGYRLSRGKRRSG